MNNRQQWLLWPGLLAVAPLTIAFVYLAYTQGWSLINQAPNEGLALVIPAAAAVVFAARAVSQRNSLCLLMAGFALIVWLRELHSDWVHHGVYYLLTGLIACAWLWRERIVPLARQGSFLPWLKGTLATYVVAVLLARRAFKDLLPYEESVNTQLEETMENVAHTLLLFTALLGCRRTESKDKQTA